MAQTFTISGPGVDRDAPEEGPAISGAITFAARHAEPATFYVRENGTIRYRVERGADRVILVEAVRT